MKKIAASLLTVLALASCGEAKDSAAAVVGADAGADRPDIRVVGSSTIFPFAEKVREAYQAGGGAQVAIQSTGTGAGQEEFCQSLSMDTPDIVNSSRRQTFDEFQACQKNGVKEIVEVKFGFDGIIVAQSRAAKPTEFSIYVFYQALAKTLPTSNYDCTPRPNPNKTWADIDPALPDTPILVYGPPTTSGTRDAFTQLAMEPGAKRFACLDAMVKKDYAAFSSAAHTLRDDGAWVDAGEDDNAIVKKLDGDHKAFGIFGYSFLEENPDLVQSATISGVAPTFENIASHQYRLSRPLYFYIKKAHIARLPAIKDYALAFLSEESAGDTGYLKEIGLVPLPSTERATYRKAIETETVLQAKD